eukprot:m51a1_g548 hypothetical protein (438) ;mRNA; r:444020-445333
MDALSPAWLLRTLVVPRLDDPRDLVSLALAHPPALASPCLLRLRSQRPPLLPASPLPDASAHLPLVLDRAVACAAAGDHASLAALSAPHAGLRAALSLGCSRSAPFSELLCACLWACGALCADERCRGPLRDLAVWPAREPPAPGRLLLLCARYSMRETLGAAVANAQRLFGSAAGLVGAAADALHVAAERGDLGVCAVLSAAPFGAPGSWALRLACVSGHADVAQLLVQRGAAMDQDSARTCLAAACASGHGDVLALLERPPFALGPEDARAHENRALRSACRNGHAHILRALARRPWCLGAEDARAGGNDALRMACGRGHLEVVRELRGSPWNLGPVDVRSKGLAAFQWACRTGQAHIVKELGGAPWLVTGDEARMKENRALQWACKYRRTEVVRELANEPFSLGHVDAMSAVVYAAGSGEVAAVLAQPPYSLVV